MADFTLILMKDSGEGYATKPSLRSPAWVKDRVILAPVSQHLGLLLESLDHVVQN